MTHSNDHRSNPNGAGLWGLPDPDTQAEFYQDVTLKRLLAWFIDVVLIVGIFFCIGLLTFGIGFFLSGLVYLAVGFVYRMTTLTNKSATLGMRLTAIELRRHDGQRFDRQTAALHTLGYYLSMSTFILQMISIVMMFTTARGQGLVDMVLGTAAINRASERR
ncbi:RDD family protein [Aliiroseovarius sp. S1123]|uniref:RDD family protein n=1 Tax=unclassified Aliiroseovarius TaxID=2623558 RepID=UPI001FF2CACE|nr:RDD family protein [Aliiroseovarius sp. S1123]MCK0170188.1 RDD family protein [Aliiroseovarius sp. S1123]